ncbi:MAG: hypothetical protein ABSH04_03310 [Acidimicrobiales bacterium]|jgi:hypothetical protein
MDDRSDRGGVSVVSATWFTGHERPSRTFPEGRVCGEAGCGTKLSIYNEGDYCYLHEPETMPRLRGKKIA